MNGKWGYGDANTGEAAIPPKFVFCDCHEYDFARYSLTGDFGGLDRLCQDGGLLICAPGYGRTPNMSMIFHDFWEERRVEIRELEEARNV